VREAGIDGYRCDVAGYVPVDFWNNARRELDAIKPVFMLAEWETAELHAEAFDATYAWEWNKAAHEATAGGKGIPPLRTYYSQQDNAWPREAMRMMYITNHDVNAWEGTEAGRFGPGLEAATVLSVVSAGIPLIYNGQEAGSDRQLKFFEKDPIAWQEHPRGDLYRRLFALKKANTALWNAQWGARMIDVPNSAPQHVLSFVRQDEQNKVFALFNFSQQKRRVTFDSELSPGRYTDFATGQSVELRAGDAVELPAWGYQVLTR
jgi:glycosidase